MTAEVRLVEQRTPGPRVTRMRARRRRRRTRRLAVLVAVSAVAALTGGWPRSVGMGPALPIAGPASENIAAEGGPENGGISAVATTAAQDTLLLVRHDAAGGPATGVTLLSAGPGAAGHIVFLPVGTLVDIPGFGLDRLGLSYQYGGPGLTLAAAENTLGIDIDEVATVTDSGLASLLGRSGGLELDVESQLVLRRQDGTAVVRFEPGRQVLDGQRLAEFWSFSTRPGDETETLGRQRLVWDRLFRQMGTDPALAQRVIADGAPQLATAATPAWVASVLRRLTQAQVGESLTFRTLDVVAFGGPGPDGAATYRVDSAAVAALREGPLTASVESGRGRDAVRIQILNGVGTPGIGQQVDADLEGGGFRVVLTDNARSFDFAQTLILVYDESERARAAAQQVRERLGVGTIQVSRQPQSVVDLTVVVGADYVRGSQE